MCIQPAYTVRPRRASKRTDGRRLFVYTNSGNVAQRKGYACELDSSDVPVPSPSSAPDL
jgi:hypothetical protein